MLLQLFQFFPLCPSTPHSLRQHHIVDHVHGSLVYILWLLHLLYCTLHPHGYSVTTYLHFLIPLSLCAFPHTLLPSGDNHQNALRIHDSVSVLLVCLVCLLCSIVDGCLFTAILLFIVLIFFFLNNPFNISYNNGLVTMNSFSFYFV